MRDLYCIRDVVLFQGYCTVQGLLTCVMRLEMYPVLEDRVMCPRLFPQFSTDSGRATVTNNRRYG